MPVFECLERITHREYRLWLIHFRKELDQPSRTDYYLMQIAREVRRVLSKKPNKIQLKDFLIPFGKPPRKQLTKEEKTAESKGFWKLMKSVNLRGKKRP